jgi:DNA-binding transcriptional LysR family regulator
MLDAVVAGLGLGVLPCFLCDGVADLVCLETVGGRQPEDIWLVTHPDTRKVVRVRVVVDWLKEIFERNAARLAPPP